MHQFRWYKILLVYLVTMSCGYGWAQDADKFTRPADAIERGLDPLTASSEEARADRKAALDRAMLAAERAAEEKFPKLFTPEVKALLEENDSDSQLRRLMKQRCRAAISECGARLTTYQGGLSSILPVLECSQRVTSSLLALEPSRSTRLLILQHAVDVTRQVEQYSEENMMGGIGSAQDLHLARYLRLDAEIKLLSESESESTDHPTRTNPDNR